MKKLFLLCAAATLLLTIMPSCSKEQAANLPKTESAFANAPTGQPAKKDDGAITAVNPAAVTTAQTGGELVSGAVDKCENTLEIWLNGLSRTRARELLNKVGRYFWKSNSSENLLTNPTTEMTIYYGASTKPLYFDGCVKLNGEIILEGDIIYPKLAENELGIVGDWVGFQMYMLYSYDDIVSLYPLSENTDANITTTVTTFPRWNNPLPPN